MKAFPFALAFLSLIFMPSVSMRSDIVKLMACAACLMLTKDRTRRTFRFSVLSTPMPTVFAWCWLGWALFGAFLSDHRTMAFYGYHLRWEGWFTWFILFCAGHFYWKAFRSTMAVEVIAAVVLALIPGTLVILEQIHRTQPIVAELIFKWIVHPRLTVSEFSGVAGALLYCMHPAACLIAIPTLLIGSCRGAFMGMLVGAFAYSFLTNQKKEVVYKWLAAIMIALCVLIPLTPLGSKLRRINISAFGEGSRIEFLEQACELSRRVPLAGFGLDTLSEHLHVPHNPHREQDAGTDKTHNVAFDLILQTGWIGYALALLAFSSALAITWKYRGGQNCACFAGLLAWVVMGLVNPQGILAHFMMMVCLFGIRKPEQEK